MDPENNDNRSSMSCTAASATKERYEATFFMGYASDKNLLSSLSRKNLDFPVQPSDWMKGRAESNEKPGGEMVKIEKENSHSSMESDSRCSNFLFVQGINKLTINGTKGGRSMNHDAEFLNDEAQDRERPSAEELQADLDRRTSSEVGGVSQEDLAAESSQEFNKEKNENHCSSTDHDPMLDPMSNLQAAQEALKRELQRFKEIETEELTIHQPLQDVGKRAEFTSGGGDFPGPSTSEQSQSGDGTQHSFNSLDSEGLFRQKIEAEVEYLTISRAVEKLKVAAVEQVTLLEEQKNLASEQAQIVKKLGDAKSKAASLETQAKKLENCCEDIMTTDEMLKLKNRVCKYSTCFLIQLVSLVILGLFLLQISPDYVEVVPT